MTIPVETLVRRATVVAVGLLLGVFIAAMGAAGARSIDGSGPITSELTVAVADADWGLAPAARSSLGQRETDPAPRRVTVGTVGVLAGVLTYLALGSTRAGGPPTVMALRPVAPRRRTCRAPPLPQPL